MIEYRAILSKDIAFQSGKKIRKGTIVYASETDNDQWIGSHYNDKGGSTAFALELEDFRILTSGETGCELLVVMPDPPEADAEVARRQELERRRLQHRIDLMREQADELEALLRKESHGH